MPSTVLVGLDIGSTSVRAVEATVTKDRPVVNNYGQAPLPEGAVVGGVVKDDGAVTSVLRKLWDAREFATRDVVLGVSHQQVIVREIDIARLPAKELRQALPFLVREHLPLPVDEAVIDFYPLGDDGRSDTVHGLVVAAPKEAVIDTVKAVEAAGLHVAQVDLACFAALRASAHLAGDTEALVDLGANGTTIIVHTDGTPQIVRTVPRGGAEITKMLASRMGLSPIEAERVKCRYGLTPEGTDDEADRERAEVVTESLRPLITEIRSSFNYYAASHPDAQIRRLALVGGAALLPGLAGELTRSLGVRAFLSDPLQRINQVHKGGRHQSGQVDVLGRFRSSAAVSVGLTLGAA